MQVRYEDFTIRIRKEKEGGSWIGEIVDKFGGVVWDTKASSTGIDFEDAKSVFGACIYKLEITVKAEERKAAREAVANVTIRGRL